MRGLVAISPVQENEASRCGNSPTSVGSNTVDGECLEQFVTSLSRTLGADALLVASHHEDDPPVLLFSDGAARQDPEVERALLGCAVRASEQPSTSAATVSVSEDQSAGTVFTATLHLHGLAVTLTSLLRGERPGPASLGRERLAGLLPIAWPFFGMWSRRKDVEHRLSGLEGALHNTCNSTLLLDRAGHLLFANSSAREFLVAGRGLAVNRGRLTAASLTETLRMTAAIEHLCSPGRIDKAATPVLAIRRRHMRPLMVSLAVTDVDEDENGEPTIVARLFDPEHDPSHLIEPACRFYGLSPGETRLTRYIAEGRTLAAAAAAMGVREQTARSYLKQIFLKTETNRQAELVALMLRSAVRLAPSCHTQVF